MGKRGKIGTEKKRKSPVFIFKKKREGGGGLFTFPIKRGSLSGIRE